MATPELAEVSSTTAGDASWAATSDVARSASTPLVLATPDETWTTTVMSACGTQEVQANAAPSSAITSTVNATRLR